MPNMMSGKTGVKDEAEAFQRLYDANHDRLHRFLARAAGPQEAEDLTQIVFTKAAKSLSTFRGDAQTSTWLYRIAANVVSDWLRGRSMLEAKATIQLPDMPEERARDPAAGSPAQQGQTSPEQELIRDEMRDCIRRLIGELPDKYRTVLVLGELGGFSNDEIARALGISRGNAKVMLHRARAKLKSTLEVHCDFSRNEENELVCEPKPAAAHEESGCSGCSSTVPPAG